MARRSVRAARFFRRDDDRGFTVADNAADDAAVDGTD
jgi:hypothetical protein